MFYFQHLGECRKEINWLLAFSNWLSSQ